MDVEGGKSRWRGGRDREERKRERGERERDGEGGKEGERYYRDTCNWQSRSTSLYNDR